MPRSRIIKERTLSITSSDEGMKKTEKTILSFLNRAKTPKEISERSVNPGLRGIGNITAEKILTTRAGLPGKKFKHIEDLYSVPHFGGTKMTSLFASARLGLFSSMALNLNNVIKDLNGILKNFPDIKRKFQKMPCHPSDEKPDCDIFPKWSPPDIFDPTSKEKPPKIPEEPLISSSRFAVFVSDLHTSDHTIGDDFLDDHKIAWKTGKKGNSMAYLLDIALQAAQVLADQIMIEEKLGEKAVGIDFVLVGDAFDILEVIGRNSYIRHPELFRTLERFKQRNLGNNRVIHLIGNHDYQTPPNYESVIDETRIVYRNEKLEVVAIHGHQFDEYNSRPTWKTCDGSEFARLAGKIECMDTCEFIRFVKERNKGTPRLHSNMKFPLLPIDNVHPLTIKGIKDLTDDAFWTTGKYTVSGWSLKLLLEEIEKLLPERDSDTYLIDKAHAFLNKGRTKGLDGTILKRENAKYLVMGHSHFPVVTKHYFNMGSWIQTYLQQESPLGDIWKEYFPTLFFYKRKRVTRTKYFLLRPGWENYFQHILRDERKDIDPIMREEEGVRKATEMLRKQIDKDAKTLTDTNKIDNL